MKSIMISSIGCFEYCLPGGGRFMKPDDDYLRRSRIAVRSSLRGRLPMKRSMSPMMQAMVSSVLPAVALLKEAIRRSRP